MDLLSMLFIEKLGRPITDLFCLEPRAGVVVCLLVSRHIHKLNSNSQHKEVVIHYFFEERLNVHMLVLNAFL